MIPILGIPYYNRPDLLERCIKSIDYPVDRLVIIDNSNGGLEGGGSDLALFVPPRVHRWLIIAHPNSGVAASWNEIITLFMAPYWCLINNDIELAPGDLERMANAANATCKEVAAYYANHGASFWVITEYGVSKAGLFDFYYPAYCEDVDMSIRMDLLGLKRVNVDGCKSIHGDDKLTGSCSINSDPVTQQKNVRTYQLNLDYHKKKWGNFPGGETYKYPFNNPNLPMDYIHYDPLLRRQQQW
jgi:GT2 family glycosyltransferase